MGCSGSQPVQPAPAPAVPGKPTTGVHVDNPAAAPAAPAAAATSPGAAPAAAAPAPPATSPPPAAAAAAAAPAAPAAAAADDAVNLLCLSVVQARNLVAADTGLRGRTSDAFVTAVVELADGSRLPGQRTRVVAHTLHPVFNDRFDFNCGSAVPVAVHLEVADHDRASKSDFLGRVRLPVVADDYLAGRPYRWLKLQGVANGEVQVQLAASRVARSDAAARLKLDYVDCVGLLTLRIEAVKGLAIGASARKALGDDVIGRGAYGLKVAMRFGLRSFNSRVEPAAVGAGAPTRFDQDCRIWVRTGQTEYVAQVTLFAVPTAGGKPVYVGEGYLETKLLSDSQTHVFHMFLTEEAGADRGLTDAEKADAVRVAAGGGGGAAGGAGDSGGSGGGSDAGGELGDDGSGFRAADHTPDPKARLVASSSAPAEVGVGVAAGAPRTTSTSAVAGAAAAAAGGSGGGGGVGDDDTETGVEEHVMGAPEGAVCELQLRGVFETKDRVEQWFFERLMREFDADGSGSLDRTEMLAMVHTLGASMTEADLATLMTTLDASGDGKLDATELLQWFRSAEFQRAPLAYSLTAFLADGRRGLDEMINDVTRVASSTGKVTDAGAAILAINEADRTVLADRGLKLYDRKTGLLLTEHIPHAVATAINMMYHSSVGSTMTSSGAVRRLLAAMSAREGAKMNDPASRAKIAPFIAEHNLQVEEMARRVEDFETFNAFFYRELKPGARPIAAPRDGSVIVSPADSRMVVYPDLLEATRIWVKGRAFTVPALLGPECADVAPLFEGGALVLARLAPQDYHRWHLPVTGKLGRRHAIDGALYTVNPIAIRRNVPDVYTENKREVLLVHTVEYGLVAMVAVGATIVGSINIVLPDGTFQRKGACHGYFAFGGSTVLVLFQRGAVQFDADLVKNSRTPLETLVRVGERIGVAAPPTPGVVLQRGLAADDPLVVADAAAP